MLERACPCVASGLQKSTSSTGPSRRVSPSKRARARRSSLPPTSDLPGTERARGKRRRIGSRGKPGSLGNRTREVKGMLDGCRGCIPGADHLARRTTLAGGAACASRGQPASGSRNGRRRWKTFRVEEADSRSRAGREKRPRSSRGSAPHQRKRFARASRVRGWMTAKRQRLGPRVPVGRKRHRKARGPAEAGRSS